MRPEHESVAPDGVAWDRFEFLSGAHSDQLLAMIMALAAEVESLLEWRIAVTDALSQARIDVDRIIEESRGEVREVEARARTRRDLVGRLLAAAMPEPHPERPIPGAEAGG